MTPRRNGNPPGIILGQEGQTLSEYAMVLLFVAVACFAALTMLGVPIREIYVGFSGSF